MAAADELLKQWKAGKAKPVSVLHGEEDFLRSELLHAAPGIFVPDEGVRSFNCDVLYGPETSMDQVITLARSYPMMAERRLIIVREAERILRAKPAGSATKSKKKSAGSEDPLLQYLDQPNPDSVLIFDLDKFGARNQSPFKELAEKSQVIEFPEMKEGEAAAWVSARAKSLGRSLSSDGARLMTNYLGVSLRALANELEKLIIYCGAERKEINDKDVEQVVGASRENNVFELTKAIGAANKPLAITIALRMLDQGSDQKQFMFVMLSRFIEQLIIARELSAKGENERAIADALELRGGAAYFAKEIISQAKRYSRARLDAAIAAIVETEALTRRKNASDELLMEMLLVRLMPA
jgi:DNA polymerase-3 subunit delta